jgi:hypothetical protein
MPRFLVAALVLIACVLPVPARATILAADDASGSAYNDGWQDNDNGGFGFAPWSIPFVNDTNVGAITGSSTSNGNGDTFPVTGDIDTAGRAWGLYSNTGSFLPVRRNFAFGTMGVNHQIRLSLDNGWIESGGRVGFSLNNTFGTTLFQLQFQNGFANYVTSTPGGTPYSGSTPAFTDEGLAITFIVTSLASGASDYALTIDNLGNGAGIDFSGVGQMFNSSSVAIAQLSLFNVNAGSGPQRDAFFNSITISAIPEPTAALCLPLAGVLGGVLRTRRRR